MRTYVAVPQYFDYLTDDTHEPLPPNIKDAKELKIELKFWHILCVAISYSHRPLGIPKGFRRDALTDVLTCVLHLDVEKR